MTQPALTPTDRTTVRRQPARGSFDAGLVHAILDEAWVAHVGFAADGVPMVIPMAHWRVGDRLFLHGAPASRLMRTLRDGGEICVTVTLIDGLVLARSAFHHSMNYRSVVILGQPELVADEAEKRAILDAFVEKVAPGRAAEVRGANAGELAGTLLLALPIVEASAKVRQGPPKDDEADLALPVWAGEIPLRLVAGDPVPAAPEACTMG